MPKSFRVWLWPIAFVLVATTGCAPTSLVPDARGSALGHGEVWVDKGLALAKSGQFQEALGCWNRALKLKPDDAEAWSNKGVALVRLARHEEAFECFDRAIELKPDDAAAWSNKGGAFVDLHRHDEALQCYDRAIELDPDLAEVWSGKGTALGASGRFQEALKCFDRAIELKPDHVAAWSAKGATLNLSGQFQEALGCFNQAIELHPDDADLWAVKGVALTRLERYAEAKTALEHAASLGALEAKQLLEELERQPIEGKGSRGKELASEQKKLDERNRYAELARRYETRSNFEEARRCREEVLRIVTETYGEIDWRVTDARLDLEEFEKRSRMTVAKRDQLREAPRLDDQSNELWRQKPEQALPLAQRAMEIRGDVLGKRNRDYVHSAANVARIYKLLGEFPRAKDLYEESLRVRKDVLGTGHPDYVESLKDLAGLYYVMRDYDEADSLFEEASKITIPSNH